MLDESINLLEELDNVSKIHILERDDIDALMLEFARRIIVILKIERVNVWLFNHERNALISIGEYDLRSHEFSKDNILYKKDFPAYFKAIEENKILLAPNIYSHPSTFQFNEIYSKPNDIISLMDILLYKDDSVMGIFNVSTGKGYKIKDIYDVVARYLGISNTNVPIVPPGEDDVAEVVLDPSNTENFLGWKAKISFEDTINNQLKWYDKYGINTIFSHLSAPKV